MQRSIRLGLAGAGVAMATLSSGCQAGDPLPINRATEHTTVRSAESQPGRSTSPKPAPTDDKFTFFVSPSGNIACVVTTDTIRCDITESDWPRPPRPTDCEFGYGSVIGITPDINPDGPAQFLCVGDSAHGSDEPLAYGDSITVGPMRCESAKSGITCRNAKTGHGFSISREKYQLF